MDDLQPVLQNLVVGRFAMCQQAGRRMLAQGSGSIMNIGSVAGSTALGRGHVAYSMAKYGMSMCVLGMAAEFREHGVAVNALWPRTAIATAAVRNLLGGEEMIKRSRKPEIMADAAHFILTQPSREFTGKFCIDDEILEQAGVTDLAHYAVDASQELLPDFFVEPR